jgi:hypothetical protein
MDSDFEYILDLFQNCGILASFFQHLGGLLLLAKLGMWNVRLANLTSSVRCTGGVQVRTKC